MKTTLIALFALLLAAPAHAEEWPTDPIRIVVNAAPAGVADRALRAIAPHLGDELGQQIIVDNKPGGEGYIGQQEVARANPDGRTFLFTAGSMIVITPQLIPKADFDPRTALTPIAPAISIPMHLVVHPSVPVDSAQAFIAYAKANPGVLNYGSAGSGTALHVAAETFSLETGIKMSHIPYKGAGDALKDLIGGHFQVMFDPGLTTEHVKAGRAKMLAVAAAERNPAFPDVPTMSEIGVDGVDGGPHFGFFAPNDVSPAILQRLNAAVIAVLQKPELRQQLTGMTLQVSPAMTSDEFASYLRDQNTRYQKLLPQLGIGAS